MRKKGFTLAEALIALGIVGVIAALALPMVNKAKPDPVKVTYLKTYDSIVQAVKSFSANTAFYAPTRSNESETGKLVENGFYIDYPLINDDKSEKVKNKVVDLQKGPKKFCDALANSFNVSGSISCDKSDSDDYNTANDSFKPSFKTPTGVEVQIYTVSTKGVSGDETPKSTSPYAWARFQSSIYVDINGADGNNCLYKKDSCESPDRFKFIVGPDGRVYPGDPVGRNT
jgi:prepilin-type N-terminal cleavage/methylation domain-containing protein